MLSFAARSMAGAFRLGLWADEWVIAWRLDADDVGEEVFDVPARTAEDLVDPLIGLGIAEEAARRLAVELLAERAAMDAAAE